MRTGKYMVSLDKIRFYELTLQERSEYLRKHTDLTDGEMDALSGLAGGIAP